MNDTAYNLKFPIKTTDGRDLAKLSFRRPKGKDMRALDNVKGDVSQSLMMITIVSQDQLGPEDIDKLDMHDIKAIGAIIMGEPPSPA